MKTNIESVTSPANTLGTDHQVVAAPQLFLSLPQPHTLVLFWPTNFSGFLLQGNPDLGPTHWVTEANVGIVGTNYQATNSTVSGSRFFRLMHP